MIELIPEFGNLHNCYSENLISLILYRYFRVTYMLDLLIRLKRVCLIP